MQREKSTIWIKAFGLSLLFISIYGLIAFTWLSIALNIKSSYLVLSICLVPAILGIGIIRISNVFRRIIIIVSLGLIIFAPLGYFLSRKADFRNPCLLGLPRGYQWVLLALLGLSSIIFLSLPIIKDKFISSHPKT